MRLQVESTRCSSSYTNLRSSPTISLNLATLGFAPPPNLTRPPANVSPSRLLTPSLPTLDRRLSPPFSFLRTRPATATYRVSIATRTGSLVAPWRPRTLSERTRAHCFIPPLVLLVCSPGSRQRITSNSARVRAAYPQTFLPFKE